MKKAMQQSNRRTVQRKDWSMQSGAVRKGKIQQNGSRNARLSPGSNRRKKSSLTRYDTNTAVRFMNDVWIAILETSSGFVSDSIQDHRPSQISCLPYSRTSVKTVPLAELGGDIPSIAASVGATSTGCTCRYIFREVMPGTAKMIGT